MGRGAAPLTDRAHLQEVAYKDSSRLNARAAIYRHREVPSVLGEQVVALCDWPVGVRALDVGCGPGAYLALLHDRAVRAVGIDLSEGMCREAGAHAPTLVADAAALPVPDGAVDRLLAPHMLYHCPDVAAAARELRRVLRPGGVALIVLNGAEHMRELRALARELLQEDALSLNDRVDLDSGEELLGRVFDEVEAVPMPSRLLVPEAQPIVDYLVSLYPDRAVDHAVGAVRARVEAVIAARGMFEVHTCPGVLVCR